jgi:hypothetical protein
MRSKFIFSLVLALSATLSTACHVGGSFQIMPIGQIASGIVGAPRAVVTNNDPSVAFIDIFDECNQIQAHLKNTETASITSYAIKCLIPSRSPGFYLIAKGYRMVGKDSVVSAGMATQFFSLQGSNYPWIIPRFNNP